VKARGFGTAGLGGDLSAAATKAVDGVTGGLANAVLAGVNPVHGMYTVMVATPVAALFTSSVFMNVDSTSAIAVTAGSMLLDYPAERRSSALVVLTLLVGGCMLLAGLLRLGFLTRFVSTAVMTGFITGIAVNIILGQLGDLTGYSSAYSNKVVKGLDTLLHLGRVDGPTLAVGLATIALILVLDRTPLRKVSLLIALVVGSALVPLLGLGSVALVADVSPMPETLPRPALPDLALVPGLLAPAVALSVIALVQGAGVSQAYPNPDGDYPDTSRDFAGQGAAHVAGALFQGLPAGGSLGGTALLVKGGAASRWANVLTGVLAAAVVVLLGGLIGRLAMASLAGMLVVAGFQTIRVPAIRLVWRTSQEARATMLATFALTLVVPLQWAVFLGVLLSVAVFVYQQSERVTVVEVVPLEHGFPDERPAPAALPSGAVTVLHLYGSLFFAGARTLEDLLPAAAETRNAVLVMSLRGHGELGSTFLNVLKRYARALRAGGNTLLLIGVEAPVREQLERTGLLPELGAANVFAVGRVSESMGAAVARAQQLVRPG
jgi:sulfate permease, SulP family